jgi:aminoglycoside N3'-acetyltransferase
MRAKRQLDSGMAEWIYAGVERVLQHVRKRHPRGIVASMRQTRLGWEKKLYRRRIGAAEFREALLSLGEWEGRPVWVQSSWNDFFNVDMRPGEVIELMLDLVGPRGTLVMPAFPLRADPSVELAIDTAPVNTGLICELFRRMPDVRRSIHLRSSVAALGPDAEYLVAAHHLTEYPWGSLSPYGRLHELRGLMVGLGIVKLGFTPLHHVECALHHEVPLFEKVFAGEICYRWRRRNGETGVHTFLDRQGRIWPSRLRRYFPANIYREFRLSNLRFMSAPAFEAIEHAKVLARRNKTIYFGLSLG